MRYIYIQSFVLISLVILELCSRQCSKCKTLTKVNNSKLGKAELCFLFIVLLLNEIYLPTKFLVDTSCSLRVMSWTRCGRTDRHTYGQSGIYTRSSPFGEHEYSEYCQNILQINNFYSNRQHLKLMIRYLPPPQHSIESHPLVVNSSIRHWYAR